MNNQLPFAGFPVEDIFPEEGEIIIHFDGACTPINPNGVATYGWTLDLLGLQRKFEGFGWCGEGEGMTNNLAEYEALIQAVVFLYGLYIKYPLLRNWHIQIKGDSQMVCKMVAKEWGWDKKKWKPHPDYPHLAERLNKILGLLEDKHWNIEWIRREVNEEADNLSKHAYYQYQKRKQNELV